MNGKLHNLQILTRKSAVGFGEWKRTNNQKPKDRSPVCILICFCLVVNGDFLGSTKDDFGTRKYETTGNKA